MTTAPQRGDFRHRQPLRVRWAEVDPQGIVFNGNYLTYADVGITEYFRAIGVAFPGELAADGAEFFAVRTLLNYLAPAHFDDLLEVGIRVSRLGRSSMTFSLGIWRGDLALTSGEIVYVLAETASRRSRPLPDWLRGKVRATEILPAEE
jgi:acyl-CoA thioester hydrolase